MTLTVAGVGGIPATGVDAVVVNLVAVGSTAPGFLTAYQSGATQPSASNLNYTAGQVVSNAAVVKVGSDGKIKILSSAAVDVLVDVQGWYASPAGSSASGFTAVKAQRVLDTRTPQGDCTPGVCARLSAGSTLTVDIAGQGDVPATGVTAATLNITVVNPSAAGFLIVYPSGETQPAASNLNYVTGDVLAQLVTAKVGTDGKIKIVSAAATDVLIDVQGYFSAASAATYQPVSPARLYDTRDNTGAATCTSTSCDELTTGETITLTVANKAGLPTAADITAIVVNLTATNTMTGNAGYLKAYPNGPPPPDGTALNFQNAETVANLAVVPVSSDGKITLLAAGGTTDVIVDVQGWYTRPRGTTTYRYNPDGLRTTKTHPDNSTTTFAWDHSAGIPLLLTETTAGATTSYLYGPGGRPYATISPGGTVNYLHHDQLGSTRLITTPTGTITGSATYTEFGQLASSTGTLSPIGYAGQYTDKETGHQYLRARYYDPATGEFLTKDPLTATTGTPYLYAHGNPLNGTDPTGLYTIPGTGICIAINDPHCDNSATRAFAGNAYAAVGNALTFGQGVDLAAKLMGKGDNFTACYADTGSTAYKAGTVLGIVIGVAFPFSSGGRAASPAATPRGARFVDDATAPVGRRGSPIDIAPGTNSPASIGGRQYTGHALDRMQGRGIMPSAVDDAIRSSTPVRGADGSIIHYSQSNNISVVLNADGSVRTVSYGRFKPR
jgi:RHS repeat-associated protein